MPTVCASFHRPACKDCESQSRSKFSPELFPFDISKAFLHNVSAVRPTVSRRREARRTAASFSMCWTRDRVESRDGGGFV